METRIGNRSSHSKHDPCQNSTFPKVEMGRAWQKKKLAECQNDCHKENAMKTQSLFDQTVLRIADAEKTVEEARSLQAFILRHSDLLESLPESSLCGNQIDFDNLDREEVVTILKAFPGKWDKNLSRANETRIDYTTIFEGVALRIWMGEPPPSCRIVEEEIEVEEEIIPAHTEKKTRLVCGEPAKTEVATV
jgi:hypothetical protein